MITTQNRDEHARLEETVASLNSQLSDAHEELMNMRFVKEELELKAQSVEKAQVEEERLKANEEKFQKLKTMYSQIRDEHVKLLRQVNIIVFIFLSFNIIYFQSTVRSVNNWLALQKRPVMLTKKKKKFVYN